MQFHAAGCYAIPIRFLYGTAAEINFWDVIYYRAHEAGGAFDTSTKELAEQIAHLYNMTHVSPINTIGLRRGIADKVIAAEKYVC